jgi:hypothetical protein
VSVADRALGWELRKPDGVACGGDGSVRWGYAENGAPSMRTRWLVAMTRLAGVFAVIVGSLAGGVSTAGATPPPNAFNATAGVVFSGEVGGFNIHCAQGCNGLNPNVTIDWGDRSDPSTVVAKETCIGIGCPSADWAISGTHTYRFPGTYAASFTSVLDGAVPVPISATVSDDPNSIRPSPQTITPVVGAPFSNLVAATFTDKNPLASASDFTSSVDWGDGTQSQGTVQAVPGGFQILGGHTYSRVGSFPVSVTIHHLDNSGAPNGATATAPSQAHVMDAALTGAPSPITAVVGVPFAGPVASFSDPNPFAVASDFTATIAWGDGVTSAGTIEASPIGFLITGSHTFASPGQVPVGVHIADSQGSTTSVQALAVVSPAPPPPRTTVTLSPASPTGRHGWYRGPVRTSVSATTIIGAVVATRCQLDGAAPGSFDALPAGCLFAGGGAQITADGKHVLYAASINDAGQKERPTATSIAVDATPPTVKCRSTRPVLKTATVGALVFATVRDATSRPESQTVAVPAATSTPGKKFARLTASDNAGNTTTVKCPYQVLGQINPSLVWRFRFQGATTKVEKLVAAHLPPHATIRVLCHGAGCRSASRTVRPDNKQICRRKTCSRKQTRNETTLDLTRLFQGWSLHAGTVLEVAIIERDTIGRGFVFTMRNGRGPSQLAGCLAPRSLAPNHGC